MKSSNSPLYLLSCLLMLLLLPVLSLSADPDSLQDTCVADLNASISINGFPCITASKVSASDFFFDLSKEGTTNTLNLNFSVTPANVHAFPATSPRGLNPPHFHPHATEMGLVIKGRMLVLTCGEIFVISRGLVHFQKNVGKGKATLFTSFNSHMPRVVVLSTTLFGSQPSMPNSGVPSRRSCCQSNKI
ncbi:hypothetical protein ACB098_04G120500 [Castanea mollissima]